LADGHHYSYDTWGPPKACNRLLGRDRRPGVPSRGMYVAGSRVALAGPVLYLRRTVLWEIQWGQLDSLQPDGGLAPRSGCELGTRIRPCPFFGNDSDPSGYIRRRSLRLARSATIVTWLILPVVICLSQRLSHACLSISNYTVKLRMAH